MTFAEAIAHALKTGETATITERMEPDPAYLAEVKRLRRERVAAMAHAADVWLD